MSESIFKNVFKEEIFLNLYLYITTVLLTNGFFVHERRREKFKEEIFFRFFVLSSVNKNSLQHISIFISAIYLLFSPFPLPLSNLSNIFLSLISLSLFHYTWYLWFLSIVLFLFFSKKVKTKILFFIFSISFLLYS